MKKNPLIYFVGGAIVCAVLLVFVARDRWQTSQAAVDTIASVSQGTSDTQTAETAPDKTKEQAGATQQQAAVEPQAEPAEPEVPKKNNLVEQTDPAPAKINITPTFDIVRVEEDGAAVIAGRAEPGAEIMLTLNGDTVAETVANERGEWVVTPSDPLPKGSHNLQIVAKLDGETRQSDQVVAVAVPDKEEEQPLIVLSKPSEPSRVLQKPEPAPETQPAAETQQTAEAEQTAEANQTAETQRVAEAQTQTADQTQSEAQAPTTRETSEQAVAAVEDTARQQQAEAQQSQTDEASKSETTAEASSQQTEEQAAQDTGTTSEPAQEQTVAAVDTTAEPADTAPAAKESKLETAPTPVITKPLILETVDYNDAGDIIFAGKAEPGKTVRIYVDNQHVGDAIADNDGRWSFKGNENIAAGLHTLRIDQLRASGQVAQRRELPFERADPAKVAELRSAQTAVAAVTPTTTPVPEQEVKTPEPAKPIAEAETPAPAQEAKAPEPAQPAAETETAAQPATETTEAPKVETAVAATSAETETSTTSTETTQQAAAVSSEATRSATTGETSSQSAEQSDVVTTTEEPSAEQQVETAEPAPATQQTAAATPEPEPEVQKPGTPRNGLVVIQPGNNLWNISRVVYGRGIEYTTIYEANREQIRNPNLIYPGQIFATPGVSPPREIDPDRRTPLAEQESASQ